VIPIHFDELAAVLWACTRPRPDECSPADLLRLIAGHLTNTNRELVGLTGGGTESAPAARDRA
jgi:hypothetical protein